MSHQGSIEGPGEELGSATGGDVSVRGMVPEEIGLGLQGLIHGLVALDILLRSVDHANPAELERVDPTRQDVQGVCAVVHEIDFCEDTNGPPAHGIDMSGELQGLRVHDVDVGGRDSQDDTVGLRNVLGDEVARLFLNVCGLVSNGNLGGYMLDQLMTTCPPELQAAYLCETGQINER